MVLAPHPFPSSCFHFAPVAAPPLPHTEALVCAGGAEPTPSSQNNPPPANGHVTPFWPMRCKVKLLGGASGRSLLSLRRKLPASFVLRAAGNTACAILRYSEVGTARTKLGAGTWKVPASGPEPRITHLELYATSALPGM